MDEIEEIKRKIDIVDLISGYLMMKKAGANFKAPCPFHQEKTASFMVSPEKQIFKCFGCSKGGSVFDFVMEMEGMNFREALEFLANRAGVILKTTKSTKEYQQEKDIKTRIFQINHLSALVFNKLLTAHPAGEEARKYLKTRGITEKTIKEFVIGFAPQKPVVRDFLLNKGYYAGEIKQAGSPELFKNRIMFPIFDVMGNVIAFTGRVLDPNAQPKYLNTPETALFHKSRVIYGLDKAKQEIKQQRKVILVEGQMDVVTSHQAEIKNVVACSGTALTDDHINILKRFTSTIIFAFDQDSAGETAAKKSIDLAIINDMDVKMLVLPPEFKDAGEVIQKDPEVWRESVKNPIAIMDWYFKVVLEKHVSSVTMQNLELSSSQKKEIAKELLPMIKRIPDIIERAHYVQLLAKEIKVSEKTIQDALDKAKTSEIKKPLEKYNKGEKQGLNKNLSAEETLVGLLLMYPEFISKIAIDLDYKDFTKNSNSEVIYKFLQSCYTKSSCDSKNKVCNSGSEIGNCILKKLDRNISDNIKVLLLMIEDSYKDDTPENISKEIVSLGSQIKFKKREKIKEEYAKKISDAESAGNIEQVKKLIIEFQKIIG